MLRRVASLEQELTTMFEIDEDEIGESFCELPINTIVGKGSLLLLIGNLRKTTIKYGDSSLITPIYINWLLIILRLIFFGLPVFNFS